jgi:hypothetical protein
LPARKGISEQSHLHDAKQNERAKPCIKDTVSKGNPNQVRHQSERAKHALSRKKLKATDRIPLAQRN